MKIAIAVVGHENWGKSATLKKFAGTAHKKWVEINGEWFWVKHMSNDDIMGELYFWLKGFIEKYKDTYGLVFALCPDFENSEKKTKMILEMLQKLNVEIRFFVLDKNYNNKKPISASEISALKKYGVVHLIDGTAESSMRADLLKKYISKIK